MTCDDFLTFDDIEQPITEWALDYGVTPAVIIARLERGLSVEQAITTPMVTAPGQQLTGKHLDSYITSQRHAWQRDRRTVIRAVQKASRAAAQPQRAAKIARPKTMGRRYTFDGKTMTLREWAEHIGISFFALEKRVANGWSIDRVFAATDGRKDRHRPGVVSNFEGLEGTGAGSIAQESPEITFSEQAENA